MKILIKFSVQGRIKHSGAPYQRIIGGGPFLIFMCSQKFLWGALIPQEVDDLLVVVVTSLRLSIHWTFKRSKVKTAW